MYYIQSYKDKDFDFDYSTINDFSFSFKYTAKTKDRVLSLVEKVVRNNSVASKYITKIDLNIDKRINITLRINDLYCNPTGGCDILETEKKKQWIYQDLENIFKIYLVSFHDKMKKKGFIKDNTLILMGDKVFKYNQKLFEKIYISYRDKANIRILAKMQLINYNSSSITTTRFKLSDMGMEFKTDSISTKVAKISFETEPTISLLKKAFDK